MVVNGGQGFYKGLDPGSKVSVLVNISSLGRMLVDILSANNQKCALLYLTAFECSPPLFKSTRAHSSYDIKCYANHTASIFLMKADSSTDGRGYTSC